MIFILSVVLEKMVYPKEKGKVIIKLQLGLLKLKNYILEKIE